jgi:hypothetical protein
VNGTIAFVKADRAYDGEPVYQSIIHHQPEPLPDIVRIGGVERGGR